MLNIIGQYSRNNAIDVLRQFIKELDVQVSSFTIKKELLEHPDYPSMLSLSDLLTSWRIPNQALKLDRQSCVLEDLPVPFIAHLKTEGGQFLLINEINENNIFYSNEDQLKGKLPREKFLKDWDGIILYAEKDKESGEANYRQALIKGFFNQIRLPFLIVILMLCAIYVVVQHTLNISYLLMLLISAFGIIVSGLLLVQSIDAGNPFVQNLCSLGKKNDCNAILKSDAAKVTSWLSWSEVGFFYFTGYFIYLLSNPVNIGWLSWLNLLCLPYTLYSIGYQAKNKNWCTLCCTVQFLLFLGVLVCYWSGAFQLSTFKAATLFVIPCLLSFALPIAMWAFIKPFFVKAGQVLNLKNQLNKFKYNSSLFNQLLTSQQKYDIPDEMQPIVLGNPDAETVITMVSNPFCGPCATAHKTLDKWLAERDDLQVKIVFAVSNLEGDRKTKVAMHATTLSLSNNSQLIPSALNEWYNSVEKDYDSWAARYPVEINLNTKIAAENQKKWCEKAEIAFTPTFFVNGYRLLDPYKLDDIKYLLS